MANVSLKELSKLRGRVASMTKRTAKVRDEAAKVVTRVVTAAEVAGTAFGFGVLQGRQGSMPSVLGVPVDLLTGIGMHGMALLGVADDMTDHFISIGNGGLASYGHTVGVSVGAGMEGKGGVQGQLNAPTEERMEGMDLTEDEYAALQGMYR